MENLEIMFVLFLIVVIGYVAGKLGYMGGEFDKRLSNIIIDITCPALILSSTMTGQMPERSLILPLLLISFLTYLLLTGVAFFVPRFLTHHKDEEGIIGFALMFGNVGFIGYPIVASICGHQAIFYAAILNMINTFAVFTIGHMLITGGSRKMDFNVKILYSSPMLAAYIAMLIVIIGIDNIPTFISSPITMVGNITVPAALLIIGSSLSHLSFRTMLGNATVYLTTVIRLLLIPLTLYGLFVLMGFSSLVVNINTIIIAMPTATYGTIFCLKYGKDSTLITEITFITTLLSVLTIPIIASILGT